jgi:hypothetical protein
MARNIVTNVFSGSTPRQADHLVRNGAATRAVDCKLWHGTLESWRSTRKVHEVASNAKSIYQAFNCCWMESSKCASWAEGSTEQQHVFATNYNDYPYPVRITFDALCDPTVYRLGLPCPEGRPAAMGVESFSKGAVPRQYAYQYVDSFGNFSALSEPSEEVIVEDGSSVQVSGWTIPAGGWDVQEIRIYRTVTGYESPLKESENTVDAAWMLVDTIPATQLSYVDTKIDFDLTESLGEDFVEPPPATLKGMTWIQSMNCLAGFDGRYLYFSQNNNYHNWVHKIQLDDTVRAIVESNDIIYVATDGAPYVVPGAVDCKDAGCRRAIRMPEALPIVGAGFRSMTAVPSGAVYPTHHGLVYMGGRNAPIIITSSHYAPDDWQALHPDTAKIGYHLGRLFCFFRMGAFCMAIKDGAGTNAELEHHTELSLRPDEIFVTRTGRLLLRFGASVEEWDRGNTLLPHTYESSESLIGVPFNFGALQVLMAPGSERIQLYCDDFPALDESLFQSDHFALPLWATGQSFKWVLSGTAKVKMVSLAPSTKEL